MESKMNKKTKILNDMLAKGYIDEEEYREKLNDESFSDMDAATYRHIEEAYADADNGSYSIERINEVFNKWFPK